MSTTTRIELSQDVPGYEPEFWGWTVSTFQGQSWDGRAWGDGGYCTREQALRAAQKWVKELTREDA